MTHTDYTITIRKGGTVLVDMQGFVLPRGRITFLFGESGIGKSLTGKALFGLLDPDDLTATVNGQSYETYRASAEARKMRAEGFFVFQEPSSHLNPLMTLREQLDEGHPDPAGLSPILRALWQDSEDDELRDLLRVYPKPHRPSGGEKQRILCAMALHRMMTAPDAGGTDEALFVFDEPTGSLDNRYRDVVLGLIAEAYRRRPCTVLIITHDYSMISVVAEQWRDIMRPCRVHRDDAHRGRAAAEGVRARHLHLVDQEVAATPACECGSWPRLPAILRVEPSLSVFGRDLTITGRDSRSPHPLTIAPGTMAYLKAPSGMGKTTLAKMVMGLVREGRFSATLGGMRLSEKTHRSTWEREIWGRKAAMVLQHADEALNPRSRVSEVFDGLPGLTISREEVGRRVLAFIGGGSEAGFLERRVGSLSGGQKQRLNILRSLLLETPLLILDEPLNGLDFASMKNVLDLLHERLARGQGILLISHNEEVFDALIPAEDLYSLTAGAS